MKTLDPSEITVVIHGPTGSPKDHELALETLASVRAMLPGAEIIFSTWRGSLVVADGFQLVLSDDPGNYIDVNGRPVNINRQIVAVNGGLREATRKYIFKIRHDTPLLNSNMIAPPALIPASPHRLFECKIAMPNICVRNPHALLQLYSICDLVQFGLATDIRKLWNIPLIDNARHFSRIANDALFRRSLGPTSQRFVAEQYNLICLKGLESRFDAPWKADPELIDDCMQTFHTNFDIIDYEETGLVFPHRVYNPKYVRDTFVSRKIMRDYVAYSARQRKNWCMSALRRVTFPLINNKAGYVAILATVLNRLPPSVFSKLRSVYRRALLKSE
jgi:hypothetical protein